MKVVEGVFEKEEALTLEATLTGALAECPEEVLKDTDASYVLLVWSGGEFIVSSNDRHADTNMLLDMGKTYIINRLLRE